MEEILVFWSEDDYQKITVSGTPPLKCYISNKSNGGQIEEVEIEQLAVSNRAKNTIKQYYVIRKFSSHQISSSFDIYPAIEDVSLKPI